MLKFKLDKRSVNNITKKLKAMPKKLQRQAIRKTIDPEAKKIKNSFKSITPVGKRSHKNKMSGKTGTGFLKKSFSVRNSGRGDTAGRSVVTTKAGYYIFMSPTGTGRKGGYGATKKGGHAYWGSVQGSKKYSRLWKSRQLRVMARLTKSLGVELTKV